MKPFLFSFLIILIAATASASALPAEVSTAAEAIARFDDGAKLRLLNVWATWCAPCVAEMPALQHLQTDYQSLGLQIIGISMDDVIPGEREKTKAKVARFLDAKAITFENVYYVGKGPELAEDLAFEGEIPVTILFDREGNELIRIEGIIDAKELESKIRALLAR